MKRHSLIIFLLCAALLAPSLSVPAQHQVGRRPLYRVLDEDFTPDARDAGKWNLAAITFQNTSVTVTQASADQLRITPISNDATASFYGYETASTWDFTVGRTATVEIPEALATSHEAWLVVAVDASNYMRTAIAGGGSLITRYRTGAVNNNTTHAAYSFASHRWLRIGYDAATGEMVFATSGNGTLWSEIRRVDPSWATASLRVYLNAGSAASIASPVAVKFDNFTLQ